MRVPTGLMMCSSSTKNTNWHESRDAIARSSSLLGERIPECVDVANDECIEIRFEMQAVKSYCTRICGVPLLPAPRCPPVCQDSEDLKSRPSGQARACDFRTRRHLKMTRLDESFDRRLACSRLVHLCTECRSKFGVLISRLLSPEDCVLGLFTDSRPTFEWIAVAPLPFPSRPRPEGATSGILLALLAS